VVITRRTALRGPLLRPPFDRRIFENYETPCEIDAGRAICMGIQNDSPTQEIWAISEGKINLIRISDMGSGKKKVPPSL
jgi:hypothetical protein